jgi:hypothetical protein
MKVVHDCWSFIQTPWPERGYRLSRGGNEAFLIWEGYWDELMRSASELCAAGELDYIPILREWTECLGCFDITNEDSPSRFDDAAGVAATIRQARQRLRQSQEQPMMPEEDYAALQRLLDTAIAEGQQIVIEEWWG